MPGSFLFMKAQLPFAGLLILLAAGCGPGNGKPAGPTNATQSSGSPLTAPVDYLEAIHRGQQTAEKTVDTVSINKAIEMFNLDLGRNPATLDELVQEKYLPQLPTPPYGMRLEYDSAKGKVKMVPAPTGK